VSQKVPFKGDKTFTNITVKAKKKYKKKYKPQTLVVSKKVCFVSDGIYPQDGTFFWDIL